MSSSPIPKKLRKIFLSLLILAGIIPYSVAQPDASYYLPETVSYDSLIPTPASVIGHEVGEYHVTHDRLVQYMRALDAASDRVSLEVTGYTHEKRELLLLTITSPANHRNLETLREEHVRLADPARSAALNTGAMPVVFYLGCSIHGNEASGSNAALLIAYHLAAAQGSEIEETLKNTVILLDPSFNPDGLQRFASWVNSRKSRLASPDPNDMEHHEPWPGGRTNHYWFDLNRDWLVGQQPESQARLKKFHQWKPNVLTDHHEMGTNYTFFFQPGVPSRSHPLTPPGNLELTRRMGEFHARALDEIGSLYYTQQGYDDFYYGKGSTFPDIQGAVGILFEQASSRGHRQESENGILTFPFTIRNQFTVALSTLKAIGEMRADLLDYQRQFFVDAAAEARKDPVKAFLFGSTHDAVRARLLADIVARHDIAVYRNDAEQTVNGKRFLPGSSFVVPLGQYQYRLLKSMFEKRTEFQDSLFYDISSWTLPLAAGVEYEELKTVPRHGERISADEAIAPGKRIGGKSAYAYVFESTGYYAPRAMYRLLGEDVRIKVATDPFNHPSGKRFDRGSILVSLSGQEKAQQEIEFLLNEISREDGIDVYAFQSGLDYAGVSLGSQSFRPLKKPAIAVLAGDGVTAYDAGEIWHLLDERYRIPVTMMSMNVFNAADLGDYNTIVFPQGVYGAINEGAREKFKTWLQNGGVAIGLENALSWFHAAGIGSFELRKKAESPPAPASQPYGDITAARGAQATSGAIFSATVDLTHPLLYGYYRRELPMFKGNNLFLEPSKNSYGNPIVFTESALLSGYISKENYAQVAGASVAGVSVTGRGRVIGFTENLTFRAFWFGTNKLFMNAIFYGHLIEAGSAR